MRFEAHREKGFSFAFNVPRAIHGSMDPWHGVEVEVDGEGEGRRSREQMHCVCMYISVTRR